MTHNHRPLIDEEITRKWTHCVTPDVCAKDPEREKAHGGAVVVFKCACGATRAVERNGKTANFGRWREPEDAK